MAGLQGKLFEGPDPEATEDESEEPVAVPESSSPRESASNGTADRAVQFVEDQLRCMKLALED